MRAVFAMLMLGAMPAFAAPMGPALPPAPKASPAQQAITLYRDEYRHGFVACPAPTHANEVVICGNGRGGSANRIPLPDERGAPDWSRQATGDLPTGKQALADADSGACVSANCPTHGTFDVIAGTLGVVQVARALINPEAASDYADRHPWKPKG